jgi:hypothetical protein
LDTKPSKTSVTNKIPKTGSIKPIAIEKTSAVIWATCETKFGVKKRSYPGFIASKLYASVINKVSCACVVKNTRLRGMI